MYTSKQQPVRTCRKAKAHVEDSPRATPQGSRPERPYIGFKTYKRPHCLEVYAPERSSLLARGMIKKKKLLIQGALAVS